MHDIALIFWKKRINLYSSDTEVWEGPRRAVESNILLHLFREPCRQLCNIHHSTREGVLKYLWPLVIRHLPLFAWFALIGCWAFQTPILRQLVVNQSATDSSVIGFYCRCQSSEICILVLWSLGACQSTVAAVQERIPRRRVKNHFVLAMRKKSIILLVILK